MLLTKVLLINVAVIYLLLQSPIYLTAVVPMVVLWTRYVI